jgi:hypothetical protein
MPADGDLPTVIIQTSNQTFFCPVNSLKLDECLSLPIGNDSRLTVQKQGNLIAYVYKDNSSNEIAHVMQVRTYSRVDSIQNISLKQLSVINSSNFYDPVLRRMFISANGTLFILTSCRDYSLRVDPVLYIYS